MDAIISDNFISIFFIIIYNYQKVKRSETDTVDIVRRFSLGFSIWEKRLCDNLTPRHEIQRL